jgi:hypothetical protein
MYSREEIRSSVLKPKERDSMKQRGGERIEAPPFRA